MSSIRTRPIVMFVDDEPHNLAVFEAAMPESWEIHVFDSPLRAVEAIPKLKPNVVASDQRMPGMKGVNLLELASKLTPNAVRILVTGYSDEDLIIESVRSARIFDYIRKPWDVDDLVKRLEAALQHNHLIHEREILETELRARETELQQRNGELIQKSLELEKSLLQLQATSRELSCWVPPVVTWVTRNRINFPTERDLAVLAIDIIGSGQAHGKTVGQKSLRALALEEFSMLVLKHGGYVESTEGDAAYANFGLTGRERVCDAALAVANEFRAALRGIASHHAQTIECGIGLHYARAVEANVSELSISTAEGPVVQKRFYTASPDVDLVHRMEKHVHTLPGSNIVMSRAFLEALSRPPDSAPVNIGYHRFKGQSDAAELFLIRSFLTKDDDLARVQGSADRASA